MSNNIVISDPQTPIPDALDWTYGELVRELIARSVPIDISEFPFAASWLSDTTAAPRFPAPFSASGV